MGGGDVLDRDADGFIKRYFIHAASSRFDARENFADLAVNHVVTDAFFFQCQQDVAALAGSVILIEADLDHSAIWVRGRRH